MEAGVKHHRAQDLHDDDLRVVEGRLVVYPARAVWEAATSTTQRGALVAMDSALHLALASRAELEAVAERYCRWRGARRAGIPLRFADGGAESAGESLTRFMCFEESLPRPELQYRIVDGAGREIARTDFAWVDCSHVGEFDGAVKYDALLRPGESPADVVIREKRREDEIRSLGWGVSRFSWADVLPGAASRTAALLRTALERSRRQQRSRSA